MQRIFVSTTVLLFIVCILVGCGEEEGLLPQLIEEEEVLSELIVGSWRATESLTMVVPLPNGEIIFTEWHFTLSFYLDGRFDALLEIPATLKGEIVANIKGLIKGTYQVFDSSLVLRATDSDVNVTPPDARQFLESAFSEILEGMESMFMDTWTASVQGDILTLDGDTWQKL